MGSSIIWGPSKAIILKELFWKNGKVRYDGDFIEERLEGLESCLTTKGVCSTRESFERVFLHVVHTSMLLGK